MSLLAWAGLAATTFGAALLQAAGGFGFAVAATPFYLMLVTPTTAIQLVVILCTALSAAVLPGIRRAVSPGLLLRLVVGSAAGLPLGLLAFRYSEPRLVRAVAGAIVLGFSAALAALHSGRRGRVPVRPAGSGGGEMAAGAVSGAAAALVGMAGPPVLIYLLLAGAASQTIRATLLAFFALVYAVTLAAHAATLGVPTQSWLAAAVLMPFAVAGGLIGRPLGDRLGAGGFFRLAIGLLAAAGLLTLGDAAGIVGPR